MIKLLSSLSLQKVQVWVLPLNNDHIVEIKDKSNRTNSLRQLLSTWSRIKCVSLNWKDKIDFVKFFESRKYTKSYLKNSE